MTSGQGYDTVIGERGSTLSGGLGNEERDSIRAHERTARPLGAERFVKGLERRIDRPLARHKPGGKPRNGDARQ